MAAMWSCEYWFWILNLLERLDLPGKNDASSLVVRTQSRCLAKKWTLFGSRKCSPSPTTPFPLDEAQRIYWQLFPSRRLWAKSALDGSNFHILNGVKQSEIVNNDAAEELLTDCGNTVWFGGFAAAAQRCGLVLVSLARGEAQCGARRRRRLAADKWGHLLQGRFAAHVLHSIAKLCPNYSQTNFVSEIFSHFYHTFPLNKHRSIVFILTKHFQFIAFYAAIRPNLIDSNILPMFSAIYKHGFTHWPATKCPAGCFCFDFNEMRPKTRVGHQKIISIFYYVFPKKNTSSSRVVFRRSVWCAWMPSALRFDLQIKRKLILDFPTTQNVFFMRNSLPFIYVRRNFGTRRTVRWKLDNSSFKNRRTC